MGEYSITNPQIFVLQLLNVDEYTLHLCSMTRANRSDSSHPVRTCF